MPSATLRRLIRKPLKDVRTYRGKVNTITRILALACLVFLQSLPGCGGGSGGSPPPPLPPPPTNPSPAIVSLTPNSVTAGDSTFTLTVTGYNFLSSSTVQWNGSPRTTTYSSSTQLQVQISSSDIASAGSEAVSVINPSPGGGNSGSAEFIVNPTSNPASTLTAFNPTSVDAGSSGFVLTLYGSNFIPESTIQWNGTAVPTNYLSDTYLEAQIPASSLTDSGFAEVVVQNPRPGGGASSPLFFAINYKPTIFRQLANDLVWDSANKLIYLSVPSLASSNGNTIAALDPLTGSIQSSQFAGSEPDVLAISDDDQFLYAALDGASSVQRFTLPDLVPDLKYSLGADSYFGPYFAVDLGVAPALPHTTAVSRGAFNVSPYALGGMAIYDDTTKRSKVAHTPGPLYDFFQWGSDTNIYAINSEISSFDFYVLTVSSSGVAQSKDYQSKFADFYVRMHYDSGTHLVYTDDGYVINPANGQLVGGFPAGGYMVPDSTLNKAFFFGQTQSQFGSNSFTIASFDLATFAPIAEIVIPDIQGYPLRFIRWGTSGLAINDDAGFIYVVNDSFVNGKSPQTKTPQRSFMPVKKTWSAPKTRPEERVKAFITSNYSQKTQRQSVSPLDSNPAPTITALSPNAVALNATGLNGFTLTVTGANFVSLSKVEWNGSPRQTEFVSNTVLQAQIGFSDVQPAGSASITVVTPSPGGGTSNALSFNVVSQTVVPPPFIVSLYPNSVPAGSPGFTLQVHTNWATDSSIVYWNGVSRPTTHIGDLEIQVSAADVASVGYAQITVFTPGPGGGISNAAEFQILYQPTIVNEVTNDLVWDPLNQVIYISVPSSASSHANQVCILNPATATITNCEAAGSEPDRLAISDDSQFLYVGEDGTGSVQRFILPSLTPDISYSLGSDPNEGPYFALDLQVAPGAPQTTAVTKGIFNLIPDEIGGVTIYDDSTPRPVSVPGWGPTQNLYDSLQWGADATELYAEGGGAFYFLTVSPSGVVLTQKHPAVFWNPGRIHYDITNELIYSDDGFHVINPSTGLPVGIFEVGGGWPMASDSTLNTVFILAKYIWQENANYTIALFDMTHFTPVTQIPFSTSEVGFNPLLRFIRWGGNGLAANFKGGNLYLLSGSFVNGKSTRRSKSQLKPVRRNRANGKTLTDHKR
jgi:trimeric autotransporter adhesin